MQVERQDTGIRIASNKVDARVVTIDVGRWRFPVVVDLLLDLVVVPGRFAMPGHVNETTEVLIAIFLGNAQDLSLQIAPSTWQPKPMCHLIFLMYWNVAGRCPDDMQALPVPAQ